jgi:hypothetical protein
MSVGIVDCPGREALFGDQAVELSVAGQVRCGPIAAIVAVTPFATAQGVSWTDVTRAAAAIRTEPTAAGSTIATRARKPKCNRAGRASFTPAARAAMVETGSWRVALLLTAAMDSNAVTAVNASPGIGAGALADNGEAGAVGANVKVTVIASRFAGTSAVNSTVDALVTRRFVPHVSRNRQPHRCTRKVDPPPPLHQRARPPPSLCRPSRSLPFAQL